MKRKIILPTILIPLIIYLTFLLNNVIFAVLTSSILCGVYFFVAKKEDRIYGVITYILLLFIIFNTFYKLNYNPDINNINSEEVSITAQISSYPVKKDSSFSKVVNFEITNITYTWEDRVYESKDKILLNMYGDEIDEKAFVVGDYYNFSGKVRIPNKESNQGGFDYNLYLKTKNTYTTFTAESFQFIKRGNLPFYIDEVYKIRSGITNIINSNIKDEDNASLLLGVLFSDKGISEEIEEDFSRIGLSHILAVSGLHIGLIYSLITFIFFKIKLKDKYRITISFLILFSFVGMSGFSISALRAVSLALLIEIATVKKFDIDSFNFLSFIFVIFLILNPLNLFNISFQLSFATMYGIVFFYPIINFHYRRKTKRNILLDFIAPIVIISICSSVMTLPILANTFRSFSIISLIANILILPTLSILMILTFLSLGLSFLSFEGIIFPIINIILEYYILVSSYLGSIPFSSISTMYFKFYHIIIYFFIIFYIFGYINLKDKVAKISKGKVVKVFSVAIISFTFLVIIFSVIFTNNLDVYFLDVGQADASVIITQDNQCIMIDNGESFGRDTLSMHVIPFLHYHNIDKIDYAFITHPDNDHIAGFYELDEFLPIENTVIGDFGDEAVEEIEDNIDTNIIYVDKYDEIKVGKDTYIEIVHNPNDGTIKDPNDMSLVFMLKYKGNNSVLYTGDITKKGVGQILLDYRVDLSCDILRTPHHGDYYENIPYLIDEVNPEYCVISSGTNNYGLPDERFIEFLQNENLKYLNTLDSGMIHVVFKGDDYEIRTMGK